MIQECGGGGNIPGIDFAIGLERLIMIINQQQNIIIENNNQPDLYLGNIEGGENEDFILNLAQKLRLNGIKVETNLLNKKVKYQIKYADKINAKYFVVIGNEEIESKIISIKNMKKTGNNEIKMDLDLFVNLKRNDLYNI